MTRISVVVCTFNRPDYLRSALQSLALQTLPIDDFEIIVVDNGSGCVTRELVDDIRERMRNLRYVRENCIGLSRARNTGAKAASSPYIAYLDDDAKPEPGWLESIVRAFCDTEPAPAAVGGRVFLEWGTDPPNWLPMRYWTIYTYLDHGSEGRFLGQNEHLVGANMAFRKDVLLDLGGFDVQLGRQGSTLLSGEEAALVARLREQNLPIYYEPSALVWHAVPPHRRRIRWLCGRLFWDGASQSILDFGSGQTRGFYANQSYRDLRRIAFFLVQGLLALAQGNGEALTRNALAIIQRSGRLRTDILLVCGRRT
jgi:glucosyl-dolichyl phosphate glucuronosyltransferase